MYGDTEVRGELVSFHCLEGWCTTLLVSLSYMMLKLPEPPLGSMLDIQK